MVASADTVGLMVLGPVSDLQPALQNQKDATPDQPRVQGLPSRGFEPNRAATPEQLVATQSSSSRFSPLASYTTSSRLSQLQSSSRLSVTRAFSSRAGTEESLPPAIRNSRFSWVRLPAFEGFFAGMIMVNTVVVVVETDHRKSEDGLGWVICDSMFTVIFLLECLLRMAAMKHLWPRSLWNIFDLLLVLTSITDVWVMPLLKAQFELRALAMLRVVRLFRMLRILRLLRLLRYSSQLVLLVNALWGAFRALFWFMVLVVVVLYVFALVLTRVVQLDPELKDRAAIQEWFGSMPRSLFTLFQLMSLEGWPDIARATLSTSPWLTIFYVSFILLTNVTLLNIVAGVLTENVLSTARLDETKRQERQEIILELEREAVGEELAAIDQNGDGMMDLDELRAAEASPQQAPHLAQFLKLAGLTPKEAEELFRLVNFEGTGKVPYKDFVEAARRARGPIKSKHIVGLKRDITRLSVELDNVASLLQRVTASAAALAPNLGRSPSQESTWSCEAPPYRHVGVEELRRDFRAQLRAMEARIPSLLQLDAVEATGCCWPPTPD